MKATPVRIPPCSQSRKRYAHEHRRRTATLGKQVSRRGGYTSQPGSKTDRAVRRYNEERKQGALNPSPVMKVGSSRTTRLRSKNNLETSFIATKAIGMNQETKGDGNLSISKIAAEQ